jgi:Domain of unknown function (DUF4160)
MPELSRFLGLLIKMQFTDHPPPHFHVFQGKRKLASIDIRGARLIAGRLPRPQLMAVLGWTVIHQAELLAAWEAAFIGQKPKKIAPL